MECTITTGTMEDAERISVLLTKLAQEFIVHEFSKEGRDHFLKELAPESMRERFLGDYRFFLAEKESDLAGVAALRGKSHLYYLFVAKPYQRRGLARRLWQTAKEACMQSGHHGVISVNSSSHAVGMYERFGFRRSGRPEEKQGVIHHPMQFKPTDHTDGLMPPTFP